MLTYQDIPVIFAAILKCSSNWYSSACTRRSRAHPELYHAIMVSSNIFLTGKEFKLFCDNFHSRKCICCVPYSSNLWVDNAIAGLCRADAGIYIFWRKFKIDGQDGGQHNFHMVLQSSKCFGCIPCQGKHEMTPRSLVYVVHSLSYSFLKKTQKWWRRWRST